MAPCSASTTSRASAWADRPCLTARRPVGGGPAVSSSTSATARSTCWPASASTMARVCGLVRLQHRSCECCELLGLLDRLTPGGQPIHLILDPVSSHHSAEVRTWLDAHPERTLVFHFLPVHASWLSFIEVWFSILSRKCLKRADFPDVLTATRQIEAFITTYNTHLAHPFAWRKGVRFYQRLKDKLAVRPALPTAA